MPRRFIDLSIYLEDDVLGDSPAFAPKVQHFNHEHPFELMAPFVPGLKQEDLPDGFLISCFPHKIRGASAGWTRAAAIFDEALQATA